MTEPGIRIRLEPELQRWLDQRVRLARKTDRGWSRNREVNHLLSIARREVSSPAGRAAQVDRVQEIMQSEGLNRTAAEAVDRARRR